MKIFYALFFALLLMTNMAFAAVGDANAESSEPPASEVNLDSITVDTYIIALSDSGKAKMKDLAKGRASFVAALPSGNIDISDYGQLLIPPSSVNIEVGKRIESRQGTTPIVLKLENRTVPVGVVDNGVRFNLEYAEHKNNTVTLASEVILLRNNDRKDNNGVDAPEIKGEYIIFAQTVPLRTGVIASGFTKIGSLQNDEFIDLAVIQLARPFENAG